MRVGRVVFGLASLLAATAETAAATPDPSPIAKGPALAPGVVIERVVCATAPGQSYALYLPSHYSPDRNWPILYAFDPGARGAVPVRLAKDAAERFGWIVAGSNNSRNGPWQETAVAIDALLRDTSARVAIDPRRVYATGLSGGARVASHLALGCRGCVAAVIAQGAGLPIGARLDKEHVDFAWFGSVGDTDFNFPELLALESELRGLGLRERLRVFPGGHQWAPGPVWMEAFEWLELLAMRDGRRTRDEPLEAELLASASARAGERERAGDLLGLERELRALARDFPGRPEATAAQARLETVRGSREYREAQRRERKAIEEQGRLAAEIGGELQLLKESVAERVETLSRVRASATRLKARLEGEKDATKRVALERALGGAFVQAMEAGQGLLREKRVEGALDEFDVASVLRPEASWPHVQRARGYALGGRKNDAVKALRRAVELGLDTADLARALDTNAELSGLRGEPAIRDLLPATSVP